MRLFNPTRSGTRKPSFVSDVESTTLPRFILAGPASQSLSDFSFREINDSRCLQVFLGGLITRTLRSRKKRSGKARRRAVPRTPLFCKQRSRFRRVKNLPSREMMWIRSGSTISGDRHGANHVRAIQFTVVVPQTR